MNTINLSIDPLSPDSSFKRIAEDLLNHYILVSEENTYRICEIEFYFKADFHNDGYTHCHEQQKTSGKWYQHGSGLDITIGNSETCGGILIRALEKIDEHGKPKDYTYGPLKSLQALMSSFKNIEKHEVTFGLEKANPNLLQREDIFKAPRAGLNPTRDPIHYNKLYRFFIFPTKKHEPKGEIIASLRGTIDDNQLKELFGWKILPERK